VADCLFCKIRDGQIPSKGVYQDDRCFAFEDINPQAPTHVLVVPRPHVATLNDIPPLGAEGEGLLGHLATVASGLATQRGFAESGYRLVYNCNAAAGQTVFHVHLHLLGGRQLAWPPG
jgi:histidine triad (HIT) family protein